MFYIEYIFPLNGFMSFDDDWSIVYMSLNYIPTTDYLVSGGGLKIPLDDIFLMDDPFDYEPNDVVSCPIFYVILLNRCVILRNVWMSWM